MHPQPAIFAQGSVEHVYLDLDLRSPADAAAAVELVTALATVTGPQVVAGVGTVVGVRPSLWVQACPDHAPTDVTEFTDVVGPEVGFPATQHDAWVWIAGPSRGAVFDAARAVVAAVTHCAEVADEVEGWHYRRDRDLTGFVDGTENPTPYEAVAVAARDGGPDAGSSVVLVQKWAHDPRWAAVPDAQQEGVIGRTKADSIELDDDVKPADSHVARTVVEDEHGEELQIYRRNTAYGSATAHGTMFVGFCADQRPLQLMLDRMAGVGDGVRDALTRWTTALTGAYYVVPPVEALGAFAPDDD